MGKQKFNFDNFLQNNSSAFLNLRCIWYAHHCINWKIRCLNSLLTNTNLPSELKVLMFFYYPHFQLISFKHVLSSQVTKFFAKFTLFSFSLLSCRYSNTLSKIWVVNSLKSTQTWTQLIIGTDNCSIYLEICQLNLQYSWFHLSPWMSRIVAFFVIV